MILPPQTIYTPVYTFQAPNPTNNTSVCQIDYRVERKDEKDELINQPILIPPQSVATIRIDNSKYKIINVTLIKYHACQIRED